MPHLKFQPSPLESLVSNNRNLNPNTIKATSLTALTLITTLALLQGCKNDASEDFTQPMRESTSASELTQEIPQTYRTPFPITLPKAPPSEQEVKEPHPLYQRKHQGIILTLYDSQCSYPEAIKKPLALSALVKPQDLKHLTLESWGGVKVGCYTLLPKTNHVAISLTPEKNFTTLFNLSEFNPLRILEAKPLSASRNTFTQFKVSPSSPNSDLFFIQKEKNQEARVSLWSSVSCQKTWPELARELRTLSQDPKNFSAGSYQVGKALGGLWFPDFSSPICYADTPSNDGILILHRSSLLTLPHKDLTPP